MQLYKNPRINDYNGDLTKRWYVQFAFRDPDTQKFVEFREWVSNTHKTKTARYVAAKELKEALVIKLIQGFNPFSYKPNQIPISEALAAVLQIKNKTLRKRTAHSYNSIAHIFCQWLKKNGFAQLMPHQLNRHTAQRFFDDCLIIDKLSARTYNNRLRTLRTLFNELLKREFLEVNVFIRFALLPETEAELKAYSPNEKVRIKEALENAFPELWLASMFVYYSFVRPQELVRLKVGDIDFTYNVLHISGENSKNKKTALVMIPKPLMEILLRMRYNCLDKELFIFSNGRHLTPGSKEISPNRIFNEWQIWVQNSLGIKKGIYLFKHTGAGELFENHANPRDIQMHLRHSNLDETVTYLNKYSNKPNESLREFFKPI